MKRNKNFLITCFKS